MNCFKLDYLVVNNKVLSFWMWIFISFSMYFVMHLGLQASFGDKEWEVIQIFS